MSASGALEAVDRILNRGGEPEEVLSAVLAAVLERLPHLEALRLRRDDDEIALGTTRHDVWTEFGGGRGEPAIVAPAGLVRADDEAVLRRVAVLVSAYC